MFDIFITYLTIGCIFLMIELITSAFFGLALAVSSFVLAGYVWYTGEMQFTLIQAVLYFAISMILLLTFPRLLKKSLPAPEYPIGVKAHIGKTFLVHLTPRSDKAIDIDGVAYLIGGDTQDIGEGHQVVLRSYEGARVIVAPISH